MTKRINILANFGGFGGYQIVTYNLIKGLRFALLKEGKAFEDYFNLVPLHSSNDPSSELNKKDIKDFADGKYPFGDVTFGIAPIQKFPTLGGKYTIGYPAIENQSLTEAQKMHLPIVNEVVSTSSFHQMLYKAAGLKAEQVMFGSFDPSIYFPLSEEMRKEKSKRNFTSFLMVGKFERRKASIETITAFCDYFEEHPDREKVVLNCKFLADVYSRNIQQVKQELEHVFLKYPKAASRIFLVEDRHTDLVKLYQSSDFLLFPSRGEGIGLPLIEAMACGSIPIVTPYTSFSDYTNSSNSIILEDEGMEPFIDPFYGLNEENGGQLGKVTVLSIKDGIDKAMKLKDSQKLKMANTAIQDISKFCIQHQGLKNLEFFRQFM